MRGSDGKIGWREACVISAKASDICMYKAEAKSSKAIEEKCWRKYCLFYYIALYIIRKTRKRLKARAERLCVSSKEVAWLSWLFALLCNPEGAMKRGLRKKESHVLLNM